MPLAAAVEAAPILKLCPACFGSIPASSNSSRNFVVNLLSVKGVLSLKWNNRPGAVPRTIRYFNKAETGQRELSVLPMCILTPRRNGSVFEAFMQICKILGEVGLSAAMSLKLR